MNTACHSKFSTVLLPMLKASFKIGMLAVCLLFANKTSAQPLFFFQGPNPEPIRLEDFSVSLKANNFTDVSGIQFTIAWDPEIAQLNEVEQFFPTDFYAHNLDSIENGYLTGYWTETQSYTLPDSTELMRFDFSALSAGELDMRFLSFPTSSRVIFTIDGAEAEEMVRYDTLSTITIYNGVSTNNEFETEFGISQNFPNPFSNSTYIKFQLSQVELVNFTVFDLNGKIVNQYSKRFDEGTHQIQLNAIDFPQAGTYWYQLSINGKTYSNKLILVP